MFRREFFGVVFSSLLSGCMALSGEAGGFIIMDNRTTSVQDVSVTLVDQASQETVFDDTYSIEPDSERRIDDAFNGGVFEAEVTVNNGETKEYELGVGRCPGIGFLVRIEPDELILDQGVCD
jgi:hypothetical protein